MKRIVLRNRGPFKAADVVTSILELPTQNQGINYAEMRKRVRLLDALEAAKGGNHVDLEDADHEHLVRLVNEFAFAAAKPDLLAILDDIANAKEPPQHLKEIKP